MKNLIYFILLMVMPISASAEILFGNTYKIVGKGQNGEYQCSGYIKESFDGKQIEIHLSDMLESEFVISRKEQINGRTIRYIISEFSIFGEKENAIIKYKCPFGENVYFYEFPPLYDGHKIKIYKTVKK